MIKNRKINKVLFVVPREKIEKDKIKRITPHVGLAYVGAVLEEEGYEVTIIDSPLEGYDQDILNGAYKTFGLNEEQFKERISRYKPDVVGIPCRFSNQDSLSREACRWVKEVDENIMVVAGGIHASLFAGEFIKDGFTDFVIIGEGEFRTRDLFNALNKGEDYTKIDGLAYRNGEGVVVNQRLTYIQDMDTIPFPAYHLLNMEKYIAINLPHSPYTAKKKVGVISTSRGCPYRCNFCSTTNYWGKYRTRSPQNVIDEIRFLIETYGIQELQFIDDTLTLDRKRAMEIFRLMAENFPDLVFCTPHGVMENTVSVEMLQVMKKAGCYQITLCPESGSKEVLKNIIGKPVKLDRIPMLVGEARKLGIGTHANFVIGNPGESIEQIQETFAFADKCNFDSLSVFVVQPLPGSRLWDYVMENDLLTDDFSFEKLDLRTSNIKLSEVDPKQLEQMIADFVKKYNFKLLFRDPRRFVTRYTKFIKTPRDITKAFWST